MPKNFTAELFNDRGVGCLDGLIEYKKKYPDGEPITAATLVHGAGRGEAHSFLLNCASTGGRAMLRKEFGTHYREVLYVVQHQCWCVAQTWRRERKLNIHHHPHIDEYPDAVVGLLGAFAKVLRRPSYWKPKHKRIRELHY
jgi:hypothetical protein